MKQVAQSESKGRRSGGENKCSVNNSRAGVQRKKELTGG